MPKKNSPGGCKCCCPAQVCASVGNCDGAVSGATITVTQGGTTIGTCTTSAGGSCCVNAGSTTGVVNVAYSIGGFSGNQNVTIPTGTHCPNVDAAFSYVNKTCVYVFTCSGYTAGATVTINGGSPQTTDSSGKACFTFTSPPTLPLTISVTVDGISTTDIYEVSGSGTGSYAGTPVLCPSSPTRLVAFVQDHISFHVTGCNNLPLAGATCTFGSYGSGTTDSSGNCTITLTSYVTPGVNVAFTVSATNYQTYNGTFAGGPSSGCGPIPVALSPASGYTCCPACVTPIPLQWCVTDASGTFAITLSTPSNNPCAVRSISSTKVYTNVVRPGGSFGCGPGTQTVHYLVCLRCATDAYGNATLVLSVTWYTLDCTDPLGPPANYVWPWSGIGDPSGFSGPYGITYSIAVPLNCAAPSASGTIPISYVTTVGYSTQTTWTPNPGSITATPGTSC